MSTNSSGETYFGAQIIEDFNKGIPPSNFDRFKLTEYDYQRLQAHYGYGAGASFGLVGKHLTIYRHVILDGGTVTIATHLESEKIINVSHWDLWVYAHFPIFKDLEEYPATKEN